MASLQIAVDEQSGSATMALAGELDMVESDRVARELLRLELSRPRRIVLDLSGLTFLDSHGLATLLDAADQSASLGCNLLLVAPPEPIMQLFRITLLDRRFQWTEKQDAVEASAIARSPEGETGDRAREIGLKMHQ